MIENKKAAPKDGSVKCKYLSDDFNEICVNAESPVCADFCPTARYPYLCKLFEESEGKTEYVHRA